MLSSCKFEGSESSEVQRQFSWKTGEIGSSRRAILSPLDGSPRVRDVLFLPALDTGIRRRSLTSHQAQH